MTLAHARTNTRYNYQIISIAAFTTPPFSFVYMQNIRPPDYRTDGRHNHSLISTNLEPRLQRLPSASYVEYMA